jgi:hypothetical protein
MYGDDAVGMGKREVKGVGARPKPQYTCRSGWIAYFSIRRRLRTGAM